MGHLYYFGNLGVLSSVFIRDLHGITDRGNRVITAVETAQWRSERAGRTSPGAELGGAFLGQGQVA